MIEPKKTEAQVEIIFNPAINKHELFINKVKKGEGKFEELAALADKLRFADEIIPSER